MAKSRGASLSWRFANQFDEDDAKTMPPLLTEFLRDFSDSRLTP
jgi:hypothetical protein